MITHEHLKHLLQYEPSTGVFTWINCGSRRKLNGTIAGTADSKGYRCIHIEGRNYRAHRLAWLYMTGGWPRNQIDHVNRDRADNRWVNLREVTNQENMRNANKPRHNTSGVVGVNWHKRDERWRASIKVDGRSIHLGNFTSKERAIAARKSAERYYGFDRRHDE